MVKTVEKAAGATILEMEEGIIAVVRIDTTVEMTTGTITEMRSGEARIERATVEVIIEATAILMTLRVLIARALTAGFNVSFRPVMKVLSKVRTFKVAPLAPAVVTSPHHTVRANPLQIFLETHHTAPTNPESPTAFRLKHLLVSSYMLMRLRPRRHLHHRFHHLRRRQLPSSRRLSLPIKILCKGLLRIRLLRIRHGQRSIAPQPWKQQIR
jgi:hypothetical protein